jgi:3-deoxy-7-phosphoheptulonate synthase
MIIVLKPTTTPEQLVSFTEKLKNDYDVKINRWDGVHSTVLGLIGDTTQVDIEYIEAQDIVDSVKRVQEPYKKANRKFHPDDTVLDICGRKLGGNKLQVIAGPCSVESEKQLLETAIACKKAGATMLRGGAFKPRTSPYSFQGLRKEGIELLLKAKKETGLPIVTEIMSLAHLYMFSDVDVIQVGARNMQNFELLKALGRCDKPILLKRGLSSTLEELLMSAEYIMSEGNTKVMHCERGIRTFEPMTRNTLDVSAVPLLKHKSHLPVVVDPSHATGIVKLVEPMSLAAVAAGCDALEIEVHCDPENALSDGSQQLTPDAFSKVMNKIKALAGFVGRPVDDGE